MNKLYTAAALAVTLSTVACADEKRNRDKYVVVEKPAVVNHDIGRYTMADNTKVTVEDWKSFQAIRKYLAKLNPEQWADPKKSTMDELVEVLDGSDGLDGTIGHESIDKLRDVLEGKYISGLNKKYEDLVGKHTVNKKDDKDFVLANQE